MLEVLGNSEVCIKWTIPVNATDAGLAPDTSPDAPVTLTGTNSPSNASTEAAPDAWAFNDIKENEND